MKTKMILLIYYALACLVLAVAVPLSAQQPGPPPGQRVPLPPPAKPISLPPVQSLERRCREFLASADKLHSRFETIQDAVQGTVQDNDLDNDLTSAIEQGRK